MTRRLIVLILIFYLAMTGVSPAFADPSCPALQNPETYRDKAREDYAYMIKGRDGWLFRTRTDLKSHFSLSGQGVEYFTRLQKAFAHEGAQLAMMPIPTRGIVNYSRLSEADAQKFDLDEMRDGYLQMLASLKETGILVPDMSGMEKVDGFFWKDDSHWNSEGAKFSAQRLADRIKIMPGYKSLHKTAFETKTVMKEVPKTHTYLDFYNEICGEHEAPEISVQMPVTAPREAATSSAALFSDEGKPEISLLGTSNSSNPAPSYANFEGFLKEYLGMDVKNASVSGGGIEGAIGHYVINGDFKRDRPKIIIWEAPAHNNFNSPGFLREIIPAIYGSCTKDVLASAEGEVTLAKTPILQNLEHLNLSGSDYYLVLELGNKETRAVELTFSYGKGVADHVKLQRPVRAFPDNSGIFYAELNDRIKSPLMDISMKIPVASGSYKARLCQIPDPRRPDVADISPPIPHDPSGFFAKLTAEIQNYFKYRIHSSPPREIAVTSPILPDISPYTSRLIEAQLPALSGGIVESGPKSHFFLKEASRLAAFPSGEWSSEPIVIHSGNYDFASLKSKLEDKGALIETGAAFILRAPLIIHPGASLQIRNLGKPLLLSQERGAYISSAGNLLIINSKVFGWSEAAQKPAQLNKWRNNFRPFVTIWDGGSMKAAGAEFLHLGFNHDKAYGISLSTSKSVRQSLKVTHSNLPPPGGWLVESRFEDLYYGFYSYEAEDVAIIGNIYKDNVIYGIDPHDRSSKLIIADNKIEGSGKHGIVLSRGVTESYIFGNETYRNSGSGIMLDRNCRNIEIANNVSRFNKGDGISVYESPENRFYNNALAYNEGAGMRIRNSDNLIVEGGQNSFNKDYAFIFSQDGSEARTGVILRSVDVEGSSGFIKANGFRKIGLENMDISKMGLSRQVFAGDLKPWAGVVARKLDGDESNINIISRY